MEQKYVDDLANFIRFVDGRHELGAGVLAEAIMNSSVIKRLIADAREDARRALIFAPWAV